jgi:hypothetical protein
MVKRLYQVDMELHPLGPGVWETTTEQRLPGGARLPVRMTVLAGSGGASAGVVLVSPIPVDDALAAAIDALGPVRAIVAPNLYHHLHLGPAKARWPGARLFGPPGLAVKRKDLAFDAVLGEVAIDPVIEALPVEGAASLSEWVLYHRPSRTLVVTDLVFHVRRAPNVGAWLVLVVVSGAYGRLAQSRLWRLATKDRAAAARSVREILARDFDRLVVAHGDVVPEGGRAALEAACARMLRG